MNGISDSASVGYSNCVIYEVSPSCALYEYNIANDRDLLCGTSSPSSQGLNVPLDVILTPSDF